MLEASVEMLDNGEGVANYYINVGGNIEELHRERVRDERGRAEALWAARRYGKPLARPPWWGAARVDCRMATSKRA
ncbi:MAG: hypothetical protein ACLT98_07305 [Eggerthellaceae bacterium]